MRRIIETDVVVVGTGVAGLNAAIQAKEHGVENVLILEKMKRAGGCSPIFGMTLGINTPLHERYGLHLDVQKIFMEHMKVQNWRCSGQIVSRWFNTVGEVFAWLEKNGAHFDELIDSGDYGDENFKMQLLTSGSNVGLEINKALLRRVDELGLEIMKETSAQEIIMDETGKACGVIAVCDGEELEIHAKATVICAGSICANEEMIRENVEAYRLKNVDRIEAAMPHNTGDGHRMVWNAGGKKGLFSVLYFGPHQHPYSNACCLLLRRPHVMTVNRLGERFSNESLIAAGGGYLWMNGNALQQQPDQIQWSIIDHKTLHWMVDEPEFFSAIEFTLALNDYESDEFINRTSNCAHGRTNDMRQDWLGKLEGDLHSEEKAGRVIIADTIEELAEKIGCSPVTLNETIKKYNDSCRAGVDMEFAKDAKYLKSIEQGPFYAVKAWQGIDSIIGGIAVNRNWQVIGQDDMPIPGLYSAGIGTSGFIGGSYGFPGSESSYSMTSGYICGQEIAKSLCG